jgi:hypothetical protein
VADRLRSSGARDVLYFPVFMKKGRPGIRLSVTVSADMLECIVAMIFQETTTFGMRLRKEGRRVLKREEKSIETSYGPVRVKNGYDGEGTYIKTHIEFEDIKTIADKKNLPYRMVLEAIKTEISIKK